jgi:type II secretory pathway component PulJ
MSSRNARARGFTLIEVMGVILVTTLVLGFATDYYIDLSRATARASDNTRGIRRATALLDRVARDFESTVLLVKPPALDPQAHPWLFVAESHRSQSGADHIKFVTRNFQPRRSDAPESDLTLVAYIVKSTEDGDTLDLYRWTSPQLGDSLDRTFPSEDDEASVLMAEGLVDFGVTFSGEGGVAVEEWDSTTLLASSMLPTSLEITVAIAPPGDEGDFDEVPRYRKTVLLPMRPLDLAALINPEGAAGGAGAAEEGDDTDGTDDDEEPVSKGAPTMADCFNLAAIDEETAARYSSVAEFAQASMNRPWAQVRGLIPSELLIYVYAEPECQ